MRFSLDWIREFVKVDEAPADLARRLTSAGLAVETIEPQPDGDVVLDLEIFPNRPDCMNIYGVAREVAAATGRSLCPFPGAQEETDTAPPAAELARVSIDRADLCGRYDARVMTGVRVGPSPDWMVRRLATVGLRSVNNIVDATNYVLWEFGHPLHAFDLETLEGREIRVRLAQRAETLTTLDGVSRTLDESMLVIADAKRAVALAGVMGGAPTMVTGATVHLLLESAHFDPVSVRRTARKLGLSTDASYRFERGADPEATVIALNRVASLIRRAAGGSIHPGVVEARPAPPAARRLRLRSARVARLLGVAVEPARIREALEALHFGAAPRPSPGPADASGAPGASPDLEFEVDVPSHRQDIEREVDLIEEVARRIGYDSIPERLPDIPGSGGIERPGHRREGAIRATLRAGGFSEACTTTFASSALDWGLRQRLDPAEPAIEPIGLVNPIAIDLEILRTTLLGGLLASVARNFNHGTRDVRLFEIGRVFRRGEAPPPSREERKHPSAGPVEESVALGLALAGNVHPAHFTESPREASFYDLKGVVEALLDDLGLAATLRPLPSSEALDPDRSALLVVDGLPLGRLGAVSRAWLDRLGLAQEVFVAEIRLTDLFSVPEPPVRYRPLPRQPAVSRDLSLILAEDLAWADLERVIRNAAPDRIVRVGVLDRYAGGALSAGTVGLTVNIVYRHPDRTLSSDEVAVLQEQVLAELKSGLGVRLRE